MVRTSYSFLSTDELVHIALARDKRTEMEVELAQRLELALDKIAELEEENDRLDAGDRPHYAARAG